MWGKLWQTLPHSTKIQGDEEAEKGNRRTLIALVWKSPMGTSKVLKDRSSQVTCSVALNVNSHCIYFQNRVTDFLLVIVFRALY